MGENTLKYIDGRKIRRQYFNVPLIILYTMMLAIPYFIYIISFLTGKFDSYGQISTFFTSVWICFVFSLPLLFLRILNKYCFGRIICVLSREGIHYANKGKLRWETIEKIEYVIDSKPRYKGDTGKPFRGIIYTQGGKHVVLDKVPMHMVSYIRKHQKDIDVRILGATSLLSTVFMITAILLVCPFYVVLLKNGRGVTMNHIMVMAIIWVILGIIRFPLFDAYHIPYRFWRRILPIKWLSYLILGVYCVSFFASLIILFYFPNWFVVTLLGIYLGIVQPPVPSRHGHRAKRIPSYSELYETYIEKADVWEKRIEQRKSK